MLRRLNFRYAILVALIFVMTNGINVRLQQSFTPPAQNLEKRMSKRADWWKHAVFYEIYPRSFYDSNGDGIGDLNGITAKLNYLADLGIDAIWITPFYPSPQVDFGYDVRDYENVDPQFGTLADFDRLVAEAHKRHIKVICDFVINHTSDQHPFFKESRSSRTNAKRDWYIWRDSKPNGDPPNNWSSAFGPKAWTYDEKTKQYYYHFFYAEQPDLNWRNPEVEKAMFDSVRFWFKRGVDGFRVDAIDTLFEDPRFLDNPLTNKLREESKTEYEQEQKYNLFQPENFEAFRRLRKVAEEFGPDRVLIGETYPPKIEDLRAYYGTRNDAFQLPFNFFILKADKLDAASFRRIVAQTERVLPELPTTYALSNHDNPRAFDKFGDGRHNDDIAKLLATMMLTLRGVPFFYYGEEIGMKTTEPQRLEDVRDPVGKVYWPTYKGRDGERTPMQWSSENNAGFSDAATTWLPIPSSAKTRNVETMSKDANSVLNYYKRAIVFRRTSPELLDGDYTSIGVDKNVFAYRRQHAKQTVFVALNMSNESQTLRLSEKDFGGKRGRLKLASSNTRGADSTIEVSQIKLAPYEAMVLEVVK
ncbi:MAG: alpha glucosidase [Pyrinomonadaceae bacterium]